MNDRQPWYGPFAPLDELPPMAGYLEPSDRELAALQKLRAWRAGGARARYKASRGRLIEFIDPLRYAVVQVRNRPAKRLFLSLFLRPSVVAIRTHVRTPVFAIDGKRRTIEFPVVALFHCGQVEAHVIHDYVKSYATAEKLATVLGWRLRAKTLEDLLSGAGEQAHAARCRQLLTAHLEDRPLAVTNWVQSELAGGACESESLVRNAMNRFGVAESTVRAVLLRLQLAFPETPPK